MPNNREQLKSHFRRMDAALAIALDESKKIKALAPAYWKEQGVLATPRHERLREDVFK